jgi:hypothetical protein
VFSVKYELHFYKSFTWTVCFRWLKRHSKYQILSSCSWKWRTTYMHIYIHLENRVIVCHIIAYWEKKSTVEETGWKENFFIYTFLWLKLLSYIITVSFFYDSNKELKNFQSSCNLTDSHSIVIQRLTILSLPTLTSTCFYRVTHMTTFNIFCLTCVKNVCSLEPVSELEGRGTTC